VEEVADDDDVEARVGEWQRPCVSFHQLPRQPESYGAREHPTRSIESNQASWIEVAARQLAEDRTRTGCDIKNALTSLHICQIQR
jgi:hypothetical protein